MSLPAVIERGAADLGLELDERIRERLASLLLSWGRYRGVVNTTAGDLAEEVVEGLLTCRVLRDLGLAETDWLDVGSGGGLPGLVLAAVLPARGVLVEPRERRAAFLWAAAAGVGRRDVQVLRGRLGATGWEMLSGSAAPARATVVTSRAVFAPTVWLGLARRCARPGGTALVHVGAETGTLEGERSLGRRSWGRWAVEAFAVASVGEVPRGTSALE